MAAKFRNEDTVAVAFIGDGGISQGGFLESLNLASLQNLPVVFVGEDNDWAISMPKGRVSSIENGAQRAEGFGMPGVRVDHDDVLAVYDAAETAIERARAGNGPTLLEVQVHRRMGHFMGDAEAYRSAEDIDWADKQDPIPKLADDMRESGVEDTRIEELRERAHQRVDAAIEWAKDQPLPEPEAAYEDVFVTETPQPTVATKGGED
jgi:pyruvate dehydrogenase E1 component alpha subunit